MGELSDGLNYVTVVVISNNECKITYGNQIGEYTICTSGNYNEGTCTVIIFTISVNLCLLRLYFRVILEVL